MNKKFIISAALAAAGLAQQASAQNVVYVTGSTAFRGTAYTALNSTAIFDAAPSIVSYGYGSSASSKGVYEAFSGNINGAPTIVDCFWSGSEAGIAATASATPSQTLNDGHALAGVPAIFLNPANLGAGGTGQPTGHLNAASTQADLCFADTSQSVSLTQTPSLTLFNTVGIVPFTWAKGKETLADEDSSWTDLLNVTRDQLQIVLTSFPVASYLTGNPSDTDFIELIGRNRGSGTRVNMVLDVGEPLANNVNQYMINSTSGTSPTTGQPGIYYVGGAGFNDMYIGDNGYESGGDVKNALNVDGAQTSVNNGPSVTLGYLGMSDAGSLSNPSLATPTGVGQWLTLNGVAESDLSVEEGTYSFWGHEHLYGRPNITVGTPAYNLGLALATAVPNLLKNQTGNTATSHNNGIWYGYTPNTTGAAPNKSLTGTFAVDTTHGTHGGYMNADKGNDSDLGYPVQ